MDALQLDLATLVARLEQVQAEGGFDQADGIVVDRILTCDLPRLRSHLTPEAAALIEASPYRACAECGHVYLTEADWRREYDKAAPRMLMPFTLETYRNASACPRCLHNF